MICFRDMTFCSSDCINTNCPRHFGEDDSVAAQKWWEDFENPNGPPIAYSDFSGDCKEYIPNGKEEN